MDPKPTTSGLQASVATVAEYIAAGATSDLQVRVWTMRDGGDFGWPMIAGALNQAGERRPKDGKLWTASTARTYFGEPPRRRKRTTS